MRSKLRQWGYGLALMGGLSFVLPAIGIQFRIFNLFGAHRIEAGIAAIVLGVVLVLVGTALERKAAAPAPVVPAPPAPVSAGTHHPGALPAPAAATCPQCRAPVTTGDRFCMACGAPLTTPAPAAAVAPLPTAPACPKCGATANAGDRFCIACGSPLTAPVVAAPAQPPVVAAPAAPPTQPPAGAAPAVTSAGAAPRRRLIVCLVVPVALLLLAAGIGWCFFWRAGSHQPPTHGAPAVPPHVAGTLTKFPVDTAPGAPVRPPASSPTASPAVVSPLAVNSPAVSPPTASPQVVAVAPLPAPAPQPTVWTQPTPIAAPPLPNAIPALAGSRVDTTRLPPLPAPTRVAISDSFRRADADAWTLGAADLAYGGRARVMYLPLVGGPQRVVGASIRRHALVNNGMDYGGVQFALALTGRGVNVGQDLNVRVDLFVPTDAAGHISQAGPYFRSRAAAAGDGILGGQSAGYWVALHSTGEVKVKVLNSHATDSVVATSGVPEHFDATRIHALEMAAHNGWMEVALDGRRLMFNQHNRLVTLVAIPPLWQMPPAVGSNDGTAGIWFGAEDNRGKIGGQRALTVVVAAFAPLTDLPVIGNYRR